MKVFLIKLFIFLSVLFIIPSIVSRAENSWVKTSIPSNFISSIETTPKGLLAGEFDTRLWLKPYNGIYISKDFGQNWQKIGLDNRGIKDIFYYNNKIYAGTYYVTSGSLGFFVTDNYGITWKQIGPSFSPTKICRDQNTVYFGGENKGLWVSFDEGISWAQKIGDGTGVSGPEIKGLFCDEKVTFAATKDRVFKSFDNGINWIEDTSLNGKGTINFTVQGNSVFAGSYGAEGIYKSNNLGQTWSKIIGFGNYAIGNLILYKKFLLAGRVNPLNSNYTVMLSEDMGENWKDTNLGVWQTDKLLEMTAIFSNPYKIFAAVSNNGVYKFEIPWKSFISNSFLALPWKNAAKYELLDNITSYFDHEYPLLGYSAFSEPTSYEATTVNFLGETGSEPGMYYSSHNGIDFALPYGKEITAAADGMASYSYCKDCGNTIKIDHGNGYQTIYMHLQKEGLVTLGTGHEVKTGDIIGKVGLTGRTTGPHLHFSVLRDINLNKSFSDDYPNGYSDPFGWLDNQSPDPWETFDWVDSYGNHTGTYSYYLWNDLIDEIILPLISSPQLNLENKILNIPSSYTNSGFLLKVRNFTKPIINNLQNNLLYITNTSLFIEMLDYKENILSSLEEPIGIKINFDKASIQNVDPESIKIYYLDHLTGIWNPLPTILDLINNTATALTSHFSEFALFGNKSYSDSFDIALIIGGSAEKGWYSEYPLVSFENKSADSSPVNIFYSYGNTEWTLYNTPFVFSAEGINELFYRYQNSYGDLGPVISHVIQIDTQGKTKKKVRITNVGFQF